MTWKIHSSSHQATGGGSLEYELKIMWLFAEISSTDLNPHPPPSSNNHPVNGGGLWSLLENVPHGLPPEPKIKHITSQQILHQGAALSPPPTHASHLLLIKCPSRCSEHKLDPAAASSDQTPLECLLGERRPSRTWGGKRVRDGSAFGSDCASSAARGYFRRMGC